MSVRGMTHDLRGLRDETCTFFYLPNLPLGRGSSRKSLSSEKDICRNTPYINKERGQLGAKAPFDP